ncbi:adhesion G protein-coupled receptor L4-like isoform X3 [Biomphalaria glabrata]|uniref:Adhesion G protein-coupled receptor L4-like isoform X3 n=1 Tax=Biomphalaria glabrata TaxID=6526 RepID=A0A9W3AAQ5_BIOGL|nr:adhesion G protein-coupled receptor L4-like isoform X3 [Biomphalaria glabrata]
MGRSRVKCGLVSHFCLMLIGFNFVQAAIAENDINVTCQVGWTKLHRGCYKFVEEEATWTDAVEKCQSDNAELSVLLSQTEKDDVQQYLISNDEINDKKWWVGLTREENTGSNWIWTEKGRTQIDTKITPWFQNSQSTKKGELSATIELNSGRLVLRSDFRDDQEVIYPFICEFHKVTPRPPGNGTTESDDTNTTTPFKESDSTDSTQKVSSYSSGSKSSTPTGSARGKLSAKTSQAHNSTSTSGTTTTTSSTTAEATTTTSTTAAETTAATLQTLNLTTHINDSKSTTTTRRPPTPPTSPPADVRPPSPTTENWEEAAKMYERCYIPGTGGSQMERVASAREFYKAGSQTCPQTRASSYAWEETREGKTAQTYCSSGEGFATWPCINNGKGVTCWSEASDVQDCASKIFKAIIQNVPENNSVDVQQTIAVSAELVTVTQSENITFEDILVTSQIMSAYAMKVDNIQNASEVKTIVDNFAKVGSTLVSKKKAKVWKKMSPDDKVRSASTLLVAMENATLSLVEEIKEPKVITTKTDNIDLRLEVVDVTKMEQQELVYESNSDFATVSIPKETLVNQSEGSLAKAVFITHYSMSSLLGGMSKKKTKEKNLSDDDETDEKSKEESNNEETDNTNGENEVEEIQSRPRIASYILSASLGKDGHIRKLPKPITFTMRLTEAKKHDQITLCSFWNVSQGEAGGFWSQEGCLRVESLSNMSHTTCQCDHMTSFAILLDVHGLKVNEVHESLLNLVTIIGCVISCTALLASWVTFQCFSSLQGERNSIHKNLVVCLLIAEIIFVAGIDQNDQKVLCSVIAGFLHFFFLAAFMWMFLEGLHIIFMLVQVFDASRSRLPYYYFAGYGVPLIVVSASCLFYYEGYGTENFCWLKQDRYFIWAFAGPVAIILLVNALFLAYAMSTVCRHSEYVFSSKDKTTGSGIRAWIQGALALEILLGLTWTLGYFSISDASIPMAYIFCIANSLQGLFIFIFHCVLNKKAQKEYRSVVHSVVSRSSSSVGTHSTLTKRSNQHSHEMNQSHHQRLTSTNSHSLA